MSDENKSVYTVDVTAYCEHAIEVYDKRMEARRDEARSQAGIKLFKRESSIFWFILPKLDVDVLTERILESDEAHSTARYWKNKVIELRNEAEYHEYMERETMDLDQMWYRDFFAFTHKYLIKKDEQFDE